MSGSPVEYIARCSITNRTSRHQQTLVVYDPHSRQLALSEAPAPLVPPETVEYQNCPFCKRPLSDDSHRDDSSPDRSPAGITHRRGSATMAESGFVDQEYFRMLESRLVWLELPRVIVIDHMNVQHTRERRG